VARVILIARPSEMGTLMQWACNEYFPDTPISCPVVVDTIKQRISKILQTYFVREPNEDIAYLDEALTEIMAAINEELTITISSMIQKGYRIRSVDTFAIDGSSRFVLTLHGENHEQPLPVSDTG